MTKADAVIPRIVGVDIGGANLKYYAACNKTASSNKTTSSNNAALSVGSIPRGRSASTRFAIWEQPQSLAETLTRDLGQFGSVDSLAVTMTGELADCFTDRGIGVERIVDQVSDAASRRRIEKVAFYGVDGNFHSALEAKLIPDVIAAANWHALATLIAIQFPAATAVVDIGSTTTDIIPLATGRVATLATTDHLRLAEGSLVYVGCRRTPVCALLDRLRYRGQDCPVMNEVFATIDDARLLLGIAPEAPQDCDTSDRRPRTVECASNRIARMIGLDHRTVSIDSAVKLADQVVCAAAARIQDAISRVHQAGPVVVAGHGNDLLRFDSSVPVAYLSDHLGETASRCAPSYAVASLFCSKTMGVATR